MKTPKKNLFQRYINARISLLQLGMYETVAKATAELSRLLMLVVFALFSYLFFAFCLSEWLVEAHQFSHSQSFLTIAILNTIILALLIIAKNTLFVTPVSKFLEKILFETTEQFETILEPVKQEKTWVKIKLLKMRYAEESDLIEQEFRQLTQQEYWQKQILSSFRTLVSYNRVFRWGKIIYYKYRKKDKV